MGPPGPPGPKDSIVKISDGFRRIAVTEGRRPWIIEILPMGGELSPEMNEVMLEIGRVSLNGAEHELIVGVRKDLQKWAMPPATEKEYENHTSNWQILNGGGLIQQ